MLIKIKKYKIWLIVLLVIIIFVPIICFVLSGNKNQKKSEIPNKSKPSQVLNIPPSIFTPPTIHRQQNLDKIEPGYTYRQDVIKVLGEPTDKGSYHDYTTYYYLLPPTQRENIIYIKNRTVDYIIEEIPVDNTLYKDFVNQSGTQADGYLYDKDYSGAGFVWYIFSNEGKAFLANPSNGYTIKLLRFEPMDYSDFLDSTAKTFSMSTKSGSNVENLH